METFFFINLMTFVGCHGVLIKVKDENSQAQLFGNFSGRFLVFWIW